MITENVNESPLSTPSEWPSQLFSSAISNDNRPKTAMSVAALIDGEIQSATHN